jgi:protein-L-isoaspartate(D-aspartate) O-methyltransferase
VCTIALNCCISRPTLGEFQVSQMISRRTLLQWLGATAGACATHARAADDFADARRRMVQDIEQRMRATSGATGRSTLSEPVLRAMSKVERHRFVPPELASQAYGDHPLPIGHGQTISQPFIVALMTDLLQPRPGDVVLEVGTGSGYQAAVLAECVARVYTIEIVAPLGERARALLAQLGYRKVEVRIGDGYKGWPEVAPFDGIVVTAAPDHVPQPLVDQLKPGGRMVIPVGPQVSGQDLLLITKSADGQTLTRRTLPVRFVPLTRQR